MVESDQALADLLVHLRGAVEKGGEFVGEQAPLLAQEIVMQGRVLYTVGSVTLASILLAAAALAYCCQRNVRKGIAAPGEKATPYLVTALVHGAVCFFITLPGTTMIGECVRQAVIAWVAPRVFILEYLADKLG